MITYWPKTFAILMKMNIEKEYTLHRYHLNRTRPLHGYRHTKYKTCLTIMVLICIRQHLSNIWSSIHETLSNTEADLKSSAYKKNHLFFTFHLELRDILRIYSRKPSLFSLATLLYSKIRGIFKALHSHYTLDHEVTGT